MNGEICVYVDANGYICRQSVLDFLRPQGQDRKKNGWKIEKGIMHIMVFEPWYSNPASNVDVLNNWPLDNWHVWKLCGRLYT